MRQRVLLIATCLEKFQISNWPFWDLLWGLLTFACHWLWEFLKGMELNTLRNWRNRAALYNRLSFVFLTQSSDPWERNMTLRLRTKKLSVPAAQNGTQLMCGLGKKVVLEFELKTSQSLMPLWINKLLKEHWKYTSYRIHQNLFNSLFKIYLTIFIMIKYFNRKGFFFSK